ncbi:Hypothetical predicted protein, partial [Marmota monax]
MAWSRAGQGLLWEMRLRGVCALDWIPKEDMGVCVISLVLCTVPQCLVALSTLNLISFMESRLWLVLPSFRLATVQPEATLSAFLRGLSPSHGARHNTSPGPSPRSLSIPSLAE